MKKLDKDLYIKHAKRLGVILEDGSTFIPFLNRKDFSEVIKTQLNVLSVCEKKFPKVEIDAKLTSVALAKNFNKLTKQKIKVEDFKHEDDGDLIDAMNYLVTFCNNMFKVNLDDLVSGKKVTATDPHIDLRAKAQFDDQGPRMNSNFAFAAGGIPLAATPYENPYFVGKAYAKIQDDLESGKFYKYKTRPRIIPIMKWISVILGIILSGLFLTAGILAFIANIIVNGVFYLFVVAFGVYSIVVTMRTMVGKRAKNDNHKYFFSWPYTLMFVVLAVLFSVFDCVSLWTGEITDVTELQAQMIDILKIIILCCAGASGLSIVPLIVGGIKNPKPDPEAIDKKIKEYIDLFSAESGQNQVPPRADVQKPTKVEKPKKDSKSKDKDSKK